MPELIIIYKSYKIVKISYKYDYFLFGNIMSRFAIYNILEI